MAYTHILAPTDLSEAANHAVKLAFAEAELHQARITLLYVLNHVPGTEVYYTQGFPDDRGGFAVEVGASLPVPQPPEPQVLRRDHIEEALTHLRDLVPGSFTGTYNVEVASGDPANEIVRIARDRETDLIVMSTHGRTGLRRALLGSVTEKVVRNTPCPILIARPFQ